MNNASNELYNCVVIEFGWYKFSLIIIGENIAVLSICRKIIFTSKIIRRRQGSSSYYI